jgi:hypothetical protein
MTHALHFFLTGAVCLTCCCCLLSTHAAAAAAALCCVLYSAAPCALLLQLLDEYFGHDAELTEADAFLKAYLANKAWKEPADAAGGAGASRKRLCGMGDDDDSSSSGSEQGGEDEGGDGVALDEEEDEQFLEEVDRFEAAYNFRWVGCRCRSSKWQGAEWVA